MTPGAWVGLVVGVLGALIAAFGLAVGISERRAERKGRQVRGTVVAVEVSGVRSKHHYPVFEFVTEDGRRVRKRSSNGSGKPTHAVGDEVVVWHDAADPERSDIVGEGRIFAILATGFGLIFTAIGGAILAVSRLT